jgi:ABC-type antimicrobial peptide transport system permease subunit
MSALDAYEVQATRKQLLATRKLISPQRHRRVIQNEIVHPLVTNCVLKLRPPTQVIRLINWDSENISTRCFVTNVLAVVNVYVGAVRS